MKNETIKEVIEALKTVEDDADVAIIMEIFKKDGRSISVIKGDFTLTCAAFTSLMEEFENSEDLQKVLILHSLYKTSDGSADIAKAIIDSEMQSKENELVN